jgi:nitrite reductase (NADH) small subunit
MRHRLFPSAELGPGEMKAVAIDSVKVVVVRTWDGALHAIRDRCSHRGAALSLGWLRREIAGSSVGDYHLTDSCVVECPWHGFEFDVVTGKCVSDSRYRVRAYQVEVEDGYVFLER